MTIKITDAILAINPNAEVSVKENDIKQITWHNGTTPIAEADILAKQAELQADYEAKEYQKDVTLDIFESFNMFDSSYANDIAPSFMLNSNDGQVTQENDIRFWLANSEIDNFEEEQYNTHMIYLSGYSGENVLLFETTDINIFYSVIKSNLDLFETIQGEARI